MRRAGCDPSKRWQEQNSAWSSQRVRKAAEGAGAAGERPDAATKDPSTALPNAFPGCIPAVPISLQHPPKPGAGTAATRSKANPLQWGRAPPAAPPAPSATRGGQGLWVGGTAHRSPHQGAADNALCQPPSRRPFIHRALHLSPDGVFLPLQSNRFRAEQ